jgi:hypothetical protein
VAGHDVFRARFPVRTEQGADFHDVDYRLLHLRPVA